MKWVRDFGQFIHECSGEARGKIIFPYLESPWSIFCLALTGSALFSLALIVTVIGLRFSVPFRQMIFIHFLQIVPLALIITVIGCLGWFILIHDFWLPFHRWQRNQQT